MAAALRAVGRDVHVVSYRPNDGSVGIGRLADQLAEFVHTHLDPGLSFDLVGYSMGGLVCRYYLQKLGGGERVRRHVTLASPHRGTWMAYFLWNNAGRQMRPGSQFLTALNADMTWTNRVAWTSIWTPFDLMIVPGNRSKMDRAENRRVRVLLHPWMVTSPRVIRMVYRTLRLSGSTSEVPAGEEKRQPGGE
jgi:triacylglycerol lipase